MLDVLEVVVPERAVCIPRLQEDVRPVGSGSILEEQEGLADYRSLYGRRADRYVPLYITQECIPSNRRTGIRPSTGYRAR